MSRKLVPIHEAAEALGVSAQTLRRWEREGRLLPDERTAGGRRRYDLAKLRPEMFRPEQHDAAEKAALALIDALVTAIGQGKNIKIVIEDKDVQA